MSDELSWYNLPYSKFEVVKDACLSTRLFDHIARLDSNIQDLILNASLESDSIFKCTILNETFLLDSDFLDYSALEQWFCVKSSTSELIHWKQRRISIFWNGYSYTGRAVVRCQIVYPRGPNFMMDLGISGVESDIYICGIGDLEVLIDPLCATPLDVLNWGCFSGPFTPEAAPQVIETFTNNLAIINKSLRCV